MLTPRRLFAIGLALFVGGIAVYFIGIGMAVVAFRNPSGDAENAMMNAARSASETMFTASFAAGALVLLGMSIATAGGVRWLWGSGPQSCAMSDAKSPESRHL